MSGKSYPEFQWTDDEIQLLLEAAQNLKVEEDYKKITRFYLRATVSYVLVFLHSVVSFYEKLSFLFQTLLNLHWKNISLIIVSFLFLFKLKIIPNYCSRCVSNRFLDRIDSFLIRLVSLSESELSNPSPLRKSYRKNMFLWKQKAYPIWKLERSHSDAVWWKQY